MKFVHAADLHLDSPLAGLDRYEGAPVELLRSATRRAMENLVQWCIQEEAQLLLLAGDLFDGDWKDYSTGLFFIAQMNRLRQQGIRVVLVKGNHDAASQISKALALPDNVTELSHQHPQSVAFDELGICVHGQSYARREETRDLAADYPEARSGYLNVGLLHTCVTGRPGHEPYAPCKLDVLLGKGYDYWALGHVHQREVLCESPWVVFSGNLQGRHVRETGAKGATLVRAESGRIVGVEHQPLDVVRFERLTVTAEMEADWDDVLQQASEAVERAAEQCGERTLVVRVELVGSTAAHAALNQDVERCEAELRSRALDLERVWVERVRIRTRPVQDVARLLQRQDAIGQLMRHLRELGQDPEQLQATFAPYQELLAKLPPEARMTEDGARWDDTATWVATLEEVERLLVTRLLHDGEWE